VNRPLAGINVLSVRRLARAAKYALWSLNSHIGRTVSLDMPHRAVVVITYYDPARMNHIDPQVRNVLKCDFVEQVVISNHNPDIKIEEKVGIRNDRLVCLDQSSRRACGFRWRLIRSLGADYVISIDDDIFLFPQQLKTLFQSLIREPEVPHGFSGFVRLPDDSLQYVERTNMAVHYLCEIYAVTREHLKRYFEMERLLGDDDHTLPAAVERYGDFVLISQTGTRNPKIQNAGGIFRSDTFKTAGVALHKDVEWGAYVEKVARGVEAIQLADHVVRR